MSDIDCKWKMVSIEPKMACNPEAFSELLKEINPSFISIGADRDGRHSLTEPTPEELEQLIGLLEEFTEVITKKNLERLR